MNKGFTLVELLVVIGILAVLATAAIVVLNPAQLLAQARDANRLADLRAVQSAMVLYLSTATTPTTTIVARFMNVTTTCGFLSATCGGALQNVTSTVITGTGWVGMPLDQTSGGSALSALPRDPSNNASYQYAMVGSSSLAFELNARLESERHRTLMQNDGGSANTCGATWVDSTCWYEVGTNLSL